MAVGSLTPGTSGTSGRSETASELQTLSSVAVGHLISHVHILTLPVLLPLLKERLGVGFFELGLALTVFNVVSGLTQAPMGFLVDRIGPRQVLIAGLTLGGLAFCLLGMALSYPVLILVAVLAGLANCVYHPADYAILSEAVSETRIGRAFSVHTFAGYLGSAMAPALLLGIAAILGLNAALVAAGLMALVVAVVLFFLPLPAISAEAARPAKTAAVATGLVGARAMLTPTILSLTLFFTILALSNSAINNFSVVALMQGRGMSLGSANTALTAYLGMAALGVLAGGSLADRTKRHGDVAALGFGLNALLILAVALFAMPAALVVVAMGLGGFLSGMIMPSRDMLVRKSAPPGAAGRVFGLVTTGFNIGGAVGPILFGWIMDHAPPMWIFGASVCFMLATALYGFVSDRRASPQDQPARA